MPKVVVVVAFARRESLFRMSLPEGATVKDALAKANLKAQSVGIFGEQVPPDTRLCEGDRVEVYRALKIDPKEARRRRARRKR